MSKPHTMAIIKWKGNPAIDSYEAIQAGMNLPIGMAEVLFDYNNYADEELTSPETVAERIREFCEVPDDELQELICAYDDH